MIRPQLVDYRPLYRNWRYCLDCEEFFHPDDYESHSYIHYENNATGERIVVHGRPKRRVDE